MYFAHFVRTWRTHSDPFVPLHSIETLLLLHVSNHLHISVLPMLQYPLEWKWRKVLILVFLRTSTVNSFPNWNHSWLFLFMLCGQSLVPRSEGPLSLLLTQTPHPARPAQPSPAANYANSTLQLLLSSSWAKPQLGHRLSKSNFEPVSTKSFINFDKMWDENKN